jgi:pimeloyl-ACP methyl ester carboxylesterase
MQKLNFINTILLPLLLLISPVLSAEEITLNHQGVTLNANLEKSANWSTGTVVLMTHGTLAHNKMEIMATLQELLSEQDVSSLAINLSLGLDDRHEFYDCAIPHHHKHTDALQEIAAWLDWLKQQNVKQVVLLGHSRGGNQTAWFATQHDDEVIQKVVLIAPQTWSMDYASKNYKEAYGKDLQPLLSKAQSLVQSAKGNTLLKNIDFIYCKDTTATADAFVSYYSSNPNMDSPYLMPKIKKPLLVIAGTEDKVVKNLASIVQPLADKNGFQFNIIEGADHSFRDLYADEMVESIIEFIEQ